MSNVSGTVKKSKDMFETLSMSLNCGNGETK